MNKKTIITVLLVVMTMSVQTASADVEINKTNFPDDIFRNWILHQEYGTDGILTDIEIANVTYISVSNKGIQSMKGIEFFTALTTLWCEKNKLTSLDVSQNTTLTWLVCSDNHLTVVDVSKNTMLYSLYCANNQLATLDVTQNTVLSQLDCSNNQLMKLDLSKNTEMINLTCDCNQLTTLDVSNNTALTYLDCSDNQLTTLDMSMNTELEYLYCDSNQLTTLDMSKNKKLAQLMCHRNRINGARMDVLVESLPYNVITSFLYVIYNENDQNVITTVQVAAAKDKGWTPLYFDGYSWQEYTGSAPASIKSIDNGDSTDNETDAWFAIDGRRLSGKPSQHNVYVNNGRKIVIK